MDAYGFCRPNTSARDRCFLTRLTCVALSVGLFSASVHARDSDDGQDSAKADAHRYPVQVLISVVDEQGKPVAGARIGSMLDWSPEYAANHPRPDLGLLFAYPPRTPVTGEYGGVVVSSGDLHGVGARPSGVLLTAIQAERGLIGMMRLSLDTLSHRLTLVARPGCRVKGIVTSDALSAAQGYDQPASAIVEWEGLRFQRCDGMRAAFELFLPPGAYSMTAYGGSAKSAEQELIISPGESELSLAIDLPPQPVMALRGKVPPELRDIVGWSGGDPVRLADLRGRVVLLHFWHYACGPCVAQIPQIMRLHEAYADKGFVVLGVHANTTDSMAELNHELARISERGLHGKSIAYRIALDGRTPNDEQSADSAFRGSTHSAYGIWQWPTYVLLDKTGVVTSIGKEATSPLAIEAALNQPTWRSQFHEVYRLGSGETVKWIRPPFADARRAYFEERWQSRKTAPPSTMWFHWDDNGLVDMGVRLRAANTLEKTLAFLCGLRSDDLQDPENLGELQLSGDWIVRKDASLEDKLAAIEQVLASQLGRQIRFEPTTVEREVMVARGRFAFRPVTRPDASATEWRGWHGIENICLWLNESDLEQDWGGGGEGTFHEFLEGLARCIAMPIIDKTDDPGMFAPATYAWACTPSSEVYRLRDDGQRNRAVNRLLYNVSRQTNLMFSLERRSATVWRLREAEETAQALPTASRPSRIRER